MLLPPKPEKEAAAVTIERGSNIKPFPVGKPLEKMLKSVILIKLGDNITTDHIMPSTAKLLPYRSNIPYLSDYCLASCDGAFAARAKAAGGGIIVAGENYGQGSSREHAALVPLYLGVRAVAAQSFARIHRANLINSGILPLVFADKKDYAQIREGETLVFENVTEGLKKNAVAAAFGGRTIRFILNATEREINTLLAGGKLNEQKN
jgi:aconitate hydratase